MSLPPRPRLPRRIGAAGTGAVVLLSASLARAEPGPVGGSSPWLFVLLGVGALGASVLGALLAERMAASRPSDRRGARLLGAVLGAVFWLLFAAPVIWIVVRVLSTGRTM